MKNKIQVLTQAIRDWDCDIDFGTIKTLKMIDDESVNLQKSNTVLLDALIEQSRQDIFLGYAIPQYRIKIIEKATGQKIEEIIK